jgi:phospholipid/cholesterol/gamma-HCH transport system substrate-binding protein
VLADPEELARLLTKCKRARNTDNPVCKVLNAIPSLPTGGTGLPTLTLPTTLLPTLLPRTGAEARRVAFGPRGPTVRQLSRLYDPALVDLLVPGMVIGR